MVDYVPNILSVATRAYIPLLYNYIIMQPRLLTAMKVSE